MDRTIFGCECGRNQWNLTDLANPDIDGVGVLIGFTVPNVAIFVLVTLYYFFAIDLNDEQSCTKLDRSILRWLEDYRKGWLRRGVNPILIEKLIIPFSDAQLVNGLSLMASIYINRCTIYSYHWQIAVSCVWLASASHLATLPLLKRRLKTDRLLVWTRLVLMTAVFVMLVLATVPTGHPYWLDIRELGVCFFDFSFSSGPWESMDQGPRELAPVVQGLTLAWPLGLLTLTYVRRVYDLLADPAGIAWIARLRARAGRKSLCSRLASAAARWPGMKAPLALPVYAIAVGSVKFYTALVGLLESFFWHVAWLAATTIWGITTLVALRVRLWGVFDDNEWSVGQSMPLFLLIVPALNTLETVRESKISKTDGRKQPLPEVDDSAREKDSFRITLFLLLEVALILILMLMLNIIGIGPNSTLDYSSSYENILLLLYYPFIPVIFTFAVAGADFLALETGKPLIEKRSRVLLFKATVGILFGVPLLFSLGLIFYVVFWSTLEGALRDWDDWYV